MCKAISYIFVPLFKATEATGHPSTIIIKAHQPYPFKETRKNCPKSPNAYPIKNIFANQNHASNSKF
jgi:hypothetical protein